jgi:hypothetical protein
MTHASNEIEWPSDKIDVYLETGKKRTFASAVEWPGWCRSGRDEESALQALLAYGPRYAEVLQAAQLGFRAPTELSAFSIVERLEGSATTDFGAPDAAWPDDASAVDDAELRHFQALLEVCWQAFDVAVGAAAGKELRKGPRGGGRDLESIVQHVIDADTGYLARLGRKLQKGRGDDPAQELNRTRQAILDGLAAAARGDVDERGPRGGIRWKSRHFVRRATWHVLDHAWEIADRLV